MEQTVKQRLIEFYTSKGISKRQFEKQCGMSNGYIDKLRICPSPDKLESIYLHYPDLNKVWLLTGEGTMLNTQDLTQVPMELTTTPYTDTKNGVKYYTREDGQLLIEVPVVPFSALGSSPDDFQELITDAEIELVQFTADRVGHGHYYAFRVDGDSMDDGTRHGFARGDIVLVRELDHDDWMPRLHINNWPFWVICWGNNIRLKQIVSQDGSTITLHSLNPSPEYTDFTLHLSDIKRLFNVIRKKPIEMQYGK